MECSEDLGDLVKQVDATLALKMYNKANAYAKVSRTPSHALPQPLRAPYSSA